MIVANRLLEVESLRKALIDKPFEDLEPALDKLGLEEQVLNLVASKLAQTHEEIVAVLLRSLTGETKWKQQHTTPEFQNMVAQAIQTCFDAGLMYHCNEEGGLKATLSGNVVAAKGVKVRTGKILRAFVSSIQDVVPNTLELLQLISLTPDGEDAYINLSTPEFKESTYALTLLREAEKERIGSKKMFGWLRRYDDLQYEEVQTAKKTLLLWRWIQEVPAKRLEADFQVFEGAIRRIAEQFAWIADTLGMMMVAKKLPEPFLLEVKALRVRLMTGIQEEASGLGDIRVRGLGRVSTRKLLEAGLTTLDMVATEPVERLETILNNGPLASRLHEALRVYRLAASETAPELPAVTDEAEANVDTESTLIIDQGRMELIFQGIPVPLSKTSLSFFLLLAKTPSSYIATTNILQEVWHRDQLDRDYYVVYDQVKSFKRKAEKAFQEHEKDPASVKHLVISRQGQGFMLNVRSHELQVV
jgi:replicative superfamily II helicase